MTKKILLIIIILSMGFYSYAQNKKHSISLPLIQYHYNNFYSAFSNDYVSEFLIPIIYYNYKINEKWNIGFSHFYTKSDNYNNPAPIDGKGYFALLELEVLELSFNRTVLQQNRIKIDINMGFVYFPVFKHHFTQNLLPPHSWELKNCTESKSFGYDMGLNIEYNLSKSWYLSLNLDYLTHFGKFDNCKYFGLHEKYKNISRLNFGKIDFLIGIRF